MNRDDILKSVYEDFFGIGKIEKQNEKLRKDIRKLSGIEVDEENIPAIEIPEKSDKKNPNAELSKEDKDKQMEEIFKRIEEIYIDEKSKETLKKIVEYIRKYNEKIETQFIPFNMSIYANNKETFEGVLRVLNDTINFFGYMPKGDIGIISMYDMQNADDVVKIYSSDNNIIAFENFKGFSLKDLSDKEKILHKLEEKITEQETRYLSVLHAKSKDELNEIFISSDKIKNEFSTFEIIGRNPEIQEAYQEILDRLNKNNDVQEEMQVKLLDYISSTLPKTELSYPEYRDDLIQKISFNKQVPECEQDRSIDEIFEELDSLVGLEKVKKMLRELVDLI